MKFDEISRDRVRSRIGKQKVGLVRFQIHVGTLSTQLRPFEKLTKRIRATRSRSTERQRDRETERQRERERDRKREKL